MSSELSFNGQIVTEGEFSTLLERLSTGRHLTTLDLRGTNTTGLRLMMIASALKNNDTLETLRLGRNAVKEFELDALVDALLKSSIVFLDLSQALIDVHTITPLVRLVKNTKTLQYLDISGNLWGERTIEVIEALASNQSLTSVDLTGNRLTAVGIEHLVAAINSNPRLTKVYTELVCDGEDCTPAMHPDVLAVLKR